MSRNFRDMLEAPDKRIGDAKNILARLFRGILMEHGIMPSQWDAMVDRYFRSRLSRTPKDSKAINQDKYNFIRALEKDKLSIGRFETAINILGAESVEFMLTMNWRGKAPSKHKVLIRNPLVDLIKPAPGEELEDVELEAALTFKRAGTMKHKVIGVKPEDAQFDETEDDGEGDD